MLKKKRERERKYWSRQPFPFPGDLPNPGIRPRSPALQADSLPAEPPGKPKNIGVGSLFLLQRVFPTQELNQGLLRFRRILYQLSYPGNPDKNLQILYHIFWTKSKAFQILKKRNGFVDSLFHHYSKVGHRMLLFPPKTLVLVLLSFSIIKSI